MQAAMTARAPVEALLFDLGGVLIELDWDAVFGHWAARSGFDPEMIRARFAFDRAYERHERGEIGAEQYFGSLRERLGIDIPDADFAAGWNRIFAREVAPTVELLREVEGRIPIYGFSNTNAAHQAVWTRDFAAALAPIRKVFASSDIGRRKPELEAFEHVARAIGVPREAILFFDDTPENVAGARSAGLQAVHVRSPDDVARALAPWRASAANP